ncbi:MAG: pilus assembly PilX N-terminal domain-containing protein [Phycisphaerae bacterium]|nr:pilus assembly PilX N-terminal domain-containing protein [Phycisphaerae bacterium]
MLALIMTAVLSTMAMAMVKSSGVEVRKAINQRESVRARLAAESGVAFLSKKLGQFEISGSPTPETVLSNLATFLNDELPGGTVSYGGGQIQVTGLNIDSSCGTFSATVGLSAEDDIELDVEGLSSQARRNIGLQYELVPGGQGIFDKGIVAGGPICLTGNAHIDGANSSDEATILSLSDQTTVYDMMGNCSVQGDIYSSNPEGQCDLTGNVTIGGVNASDPAVADHIHFDAEDVEIPRPDPGVFESFATNVLSSPPSGSGTYVNIRIPAGMNPIFAGNTQLRGVVFIETPNTVTFVGNMNLQGVIVTQDPGSGATASNKVLFAGNTTLQGVETLPDEPQYSGLRDMAGASVLAPGFNVQFTGNFGTVGGTLAAEKFGFLGNASATVKGNIISFGDEPYSMTGNAHITIDRSEYGEIPPGFSVPSTLSSVASSYVEY